MDQILMRTLITIIVLGTVSNYIYVVASLLAVISTIVIVTKTKSLDKEKDRLVKVATDANDLKIAQANRDAAQAKADAATSNQNSEATKQANLQLQGELTKHEGHEREEEARLAAQNKETSDFAHSLQQQQGVMAEQAKVSPQLTPYQMQVLSALLKPYAGQDVGLHTTSETVVRRLAEAIKRALTGADITTKVYSDDMSALYQGVSVAVHSPADVPPIANTLILGLREAGIDVHPVSAPSMVAAGRVSIYLGPN